MFSFAAGVYELLCSRPEARILLAGPTASGKSVLGELLKRAAQPKGPHANLATIPSPTIGMNVVRARLGAADVTVLDVGGTMRSLWPRYLSECDAVVFVFDVSTGSGGGSASSGSAGMRTGPGGEVHLTFADGAGFGAGSGAGSSVGAGLEMVAAAAAGRAALGASGAAAQGSSSSSVAAAAAWEVKLDQARAALG